MKKNILHSLIIVMSSLMLFSFTSNNRNYQTECVTLETDGCKSSAKSGLN